MLNMRNIKRQSLLQKYYCSLNDMPCQKIDEPYINIYVRITDNCNAHCPFCAFHKKSRPFDFEKFCDGLIKLASNFNIHKISFTGGEPTSDYSTLSQIFSTIIRDLKKKHDIFTVVSTNGLQINDILFFHSNYIDSVAFSRHHYDNDINRKLFGAPNNYFDSIPRDKLHLSCNLIKGYIDSKEEICKYLDWCAEHDIHDVGFVSLMQINNYCKEHFVDFKDIIPDKSMRCYKTKDWHKHDNTCRCANYVYIASNANVVHFYSRYYAAPGKCETQPMVYDIDHFTYGFNGEEVQI